jgi:hypothetical protein
MENASRQFFLYELSNATSVQVSIDAVIVNEKTLIGTDTGHLGSIFRATRNAEHDMAVDTLKVIAGGASPDQVRGFLQKQASLALPDRTPHSYRHLYHAVKRRQAAVLLRRLNYAKPEKFIRTLKYLKHQPKTKTVTTLV